MYLKLLVIGLLFLLSGCIQDDSSLTNWVSLTNFPNPCVGDGNVLQGVGRDLNCTLVVSQLVAGTGITLDPSNGKGIVTIDANTSGGGGSPGGIDGSIQYKDGSSFQGSNNFFIDENFLLSLYGTLYVEGETASIFQFRRQTDAVDISQDMGRFRLQTTGNMEDGFGPNIGFLIGDATNTEAIASFGAVRDGSDDSGKLVFQTLKNGVKEYGFTVDANKITEFYGNVNAINNSDVNAFRLCISDDCIDNWGDVNETYTAGEGIDIVSNVISGEDASTTNKGIASFNSTNFSASSGAINTIQNINTTATPTFGGLTSNGDTTIDITDSDEFYIDYDSSNYGGNPITINQTNTGTGFGFSSTTFDVDVINSANAGSIYGFDVDITATGTSSPPSVYGITIDVSQSGAGFTKGISASISDSSITSGSAIYGSTNNGATQPFSGKYAGYFDGDVRIIEDTDADGYIASDGSTFSAGVDSLSVNFLAEEQSGTSERGLYFLEDAGNYIRDLIVWDSSDNYITVGQNTGFIDSIRLEGGNVYVGNGSDSPSVATSDGDLYTEDSLEVNGEFAGARETFPFGYSASLSGDAYMRGVNGVNMSSTRGFVAIEDGSIIGVSSQVNVTSSSGSYLMLFRVQVNGSNVYDCSIGTTTGTGVKSCTRKQARGNDTFSAGDTISVYYDFVFGTATIDDVIGYVEIQVDD